MSNCAYQIGFTKALLQYIERDEISLISSSSGGIFGAYALSADKLDQVEMMYRRVDIGKKSELLWQVFAKGLLSRCLDGLLDVSDELEIPVCFPVCYIPVLNTRYYFINGRYNRVWKKYLLAGMNFPFLKVIPSFLHGRFAIDGGAADNIPLYPLLKADRSSVQSDKLDLIIVLHFDARYDYRKDFDTDIPILELDLSYCNGFSKQHYDFSSKVIGERIDKAYEYGNRILSRLFAGDCSAQSFHAAIDEIFLAEHAARMRSSSIDRLVTHLNVISRLLRSETNCMKKLY